MSNSYNPDFAYSSSNFLAFSILFHPRKPCSRVTWTLGVRGVLSVLGALSVLGVLGALGALGVLSVLGVSPNDVDALVLGVGLSMLLHPAQEKNFLQFQEFRGFQSHRLPCLWRRLQ